MFVLDGKPISPDMPFEHEGVMYPQNWIRLATPEERAAVGITEVEEQPRPDDFYAAVSPDTANPGYWISIPYTPEQMKPRLEQYSREKCNHRINAGISHTIGSETLFISTDPMTRNLFFNYRIIQERSAGPSVTPYDFGTKVVALSEGTLLDIEQQMEDRVHGCMTTQLNLQASIKTGTTTSKEQIDAAYATVP